jgi:hypothetical protein
MEDMPLEELAQEKAAELELDVEDPLGEAFAGEPTVKVPVSEPTTAPEQTGVGAPFNTTSDGLPAKLSGAGKTRKPRQSRALSAALEIASPKLQDQITNIKSESYSLPTGAEEDPKCMIDIPVAKSPTPPRIPKEVERAQRQATKISGFLCLLDPHDPEDRAEINAIYEIVFKPGYIKPEIKRVRRIRK